MPHHASLPGFPRQRLRLEGTFLLPRAVAAPQAWAEMALREDVVGVVEGQWSGEEWAEQEQEGHAQRVSNGKAQWGVAMWGLERIAVPRASAGE